MSRYFPSRWPLSYLNLTKKKNGNVHKVKTAQKSTPRHKTLRTTRNIALERSVIYNYGGPQPALQVPYLALSLHSDSFIHKYKEEISKIMQRKYYTKVLTGKIYNEKHGEQLLK